MAGPSSASWKLQRTAVTLVAPKPLGRPEVLSPLQLPQATPHHKQDKESFKASSAVQAVKNHPIFIKHTVCKTGQ